MNLVLHLLRWDIRRFRLLLTLWLLLVAASAVLEGAWPAIAVAMAARQTVGITGNLLALAEVLFSIVFVVLVVQEHTLVGTTAFWMTRPIPTRVLLVSKVILLGTTVVAAPVAAEVVLMISYGVPMPHVASVAAQTTLLWALWLGIVMTFAALTSNMAKFALAAGGVIVGFIVAITIAVAIAIDRSDDAPPISTAGEIQDPTSGVLQTFFLIGVIGLLLLTLYRTRARSRAIAIGLAGAAIASAVTSAWPWPWLAPRIEIPAWAMEPSALQLSVEPGDVNMRDDEAPFVGASSQWRVVRAPLRLNGLAAGWSAAVGLRHAVIRVDGRDMLASRVHVAGARVAIDAAETVQQNEVMRRLLNVSRLLDSTSEERAESAVVMVARTPELRQLAIDRAGYAGAFHVSLVRHDVEAVLLFRTGASVHLGAYRFAVDRITRHAKLFSVLAREADAHSVFDRQPRSHVNYFLRNPATSEAIQGSHRELRTDVTLARFIPFAVGVGERENAGFRTYALEVMFPTAYGKERPIVFDETWIERSEVIIVRSTEGASVERSLAIANFPIRPE